MTSQNQFSSALYHARCERNLTQAQVAELFDITVRWYQKLEKGESAPNLELLCRMAKEFGLDFAEFAREGCGDVSL